MDDIGEGVVALVATMANHSRGTVHAITGHYGLSPVSQMTHDRQLVCFSASSCAQLAATRSDVGRLLVDARPNKPRNVPPSMTRHTPEANRLPQSQ